MELLKLVHLKSSGHNCIIEENGKIRHEERNASIVSILHNFFPICQQEVFNPTFRVIRS